MVVTYEVSYSNGNDSHEFLGAGMYLPVLIKFFPFALKCYFISKTVRCFSCTCITHCTRNKEKLSPAEINTNKYSQSALFLHLIIITVITTKIQIVYTFLTTPTFTQSIFSSQLSLISSPFFQW
jgi:hypothetical protein